MFHATELAGEGPEREFLVDEVVECMYDTLQAAFKWYFENDANKKVGIHLAVSKLSYCVFNSAAPECTEGRGQHSKFEGHGFGNGREQ